MSAPFTLPDRYRLEGPVASGGMASVWAAHDTVLDRPVAVKVLAEHLGEDVAARERFQREARAAAALSSHQSVVTIFDVGAHDGRSFIVMELFNGGTVGDALRAGKIEPARAIRWLRSAAEGLDAAHAAGVVHRDIKPANLLLDDQDRLAVADFGIARLAYEDQVTSTGQILGTAAYISPEQAEGIPATDASDRYALAAVAFEMLTGERPFEAEHFAAQARAHIEDPPPSASQRNPALPPAVDAVLVRGLAKNPDERWPSAGAFVDALAEALDDTKTAATQVIAGDDHTEATRPMAVAAPLPPTPTPTPPRAAAAPPRRVEPRRRAAVPPPPDRGGNKALWALGALLAAIVAIVLIASALGGDDDPESTTDARNTPTAEATQDATREATPEPTQEATPEPTAEPEPEGDASALNLKGDALFKQGRYAEAIPFFRQAVEKCGDSDAMDPCGYALYNLGASLNRSGDPAAAIPILEDRLERFGDNEAGDVQRELDAARAALDGGGNGKGKGKAKKDKSD